MRLHILETCTAVCQIQIRDKETITNTLNFTVRIEKNIINDETVVAENSPTVIQKALIDIDKINNDIVLVAATMQEILREYKTLAKKEDIDKLNSRVDKIVLDTNKVVELDRKIDGLKSIYPPLASRKRHHFIVRDIGFVEGWGMDALKETPDVGDKTVIELSGGGYLLGIFVYISPKRGGTLTAYASGYMYGKDRYNKDGITTSSYISKSGIRYSQIPNLLPKEKETKVTFRLTLDDRVIMTKSVTLIGDYISGYSSPYHRKSGTELYFTMASKMAPACCLYDGMETSGYRGSNSKQYMTYMEYIAEDGGGSRFFKPSYRDWNFANYSFPVPDDEPEKRITTDQQALNVLPPNGYRINKSLKLELLAGQSVFGYTAHDEIEKDREHGNYRYIYAPTTISTGIMYLEDYEE